MKIHASITDFPVLSKVETSFREYKSAGVDAVEIVLGLKSRANIKHIARFSKKYKLPIASIHQPAWSFSGVYFDTKFVSYAQELECAKIVCHPLMFHTFESREMKKYFEKLVHIQEAYGVHVMVENMPNDFTYAKLHRFPKKTLIAHMAKISSIADEYGFLLTYDVSHAELIRPQEEAVFQEMFHKIGNIHLSSFDGGMHHLPLTLGAFDSTSFLEYLAKKKYAGLITLEVFYPRWTFFHTNKQFQAIKDSVGVFRKITDKLQ